MRNLVVPSMLLSLILFSSCKNNENQQKIDQAEAEGAKVIATECYQAIYEKDTVDLSLNTLKSGKMGGQLTMNFDKKPRKIGDINGEFKGDTLFIDYTFTEEGTKAPVFKNPMAFLKRGDELIIGNGTIQVTMGVSYLVKDQPIDFERVKYKLKKQQCLSK